MSDIYKIQLNEQPSMYDIQDTLAREQITDLKKNVEDYEYEGIRKGKQRQVGKACLWYHNLYEFGSNDDEAAAVIAQNDLVVAGGSLWSMNPISDADRDRQTKIIEKARALNPNLKIFFYITIASWRKDGDWTHILGKGGVYDEEEASKHPGAVRIHTKWEMFQMLEYAAHAGGTKTGEKEFIETYKWTDDDGIEHTEDKYIDLYQGGVKMDGCFYDDAGMENNEGRINQGFPADLRSKYIQLVDFTRSRGLCAFPNQLSSDWYDEAISTANPKGLPSAIGENDYMLLESCHSQVGFNGKPLWRHVNGTEGVWNYYQNFYPKCRAKVVVNDYLYGTGGNEGISTEEKQQLATYLLCDSLCCGAHYIDMNGMKVYEYPKLFDKLLIPNDEEYNIVRKEKGHYFLYVNGHTLEVMRKDTLSQGETVSLKTLNKIYIYFDGVRIKNIFKELPEYSVTTDDRIQAVEDDILEMKTSTKGTANIYHRMMIDDWGKDFKYTNYGNDLYQTIIGKTKGIATIESQDDSTNSFRITRTSATQMDSNVYIDATNKRGHTIEYGFTANTVSSNSLLGVSMYGDNGIGWTGITTNSNKKQRSTLYGNDFNGWIGRVKIPDEDVELAKEQLQVRFCINGATGNTLDISNLYVIDVDEFDEDISKDFYTNLMPSINSVTKLGNDSFTINKVSDYSFDITYDKIDKYAQWDGIQFNFPDGTFVPGHNYEFGCETWEDNTTGTGIAFRLFIVSERWCPKTYMIDSKVFNAKRHGIQFQVPESQTKTSGSITFRNVNSKGSMSASNPQKVTIRNLYLYDLDEQGIVFRGQDPSNSYLQICRVTEEKLAQDTKLIGNALYITNSGNMFITDFNGNRIDIVNNSQK